MSTGHEVAIDIDHLRVVRGKRPALHDFSVRVARGSITGQVKAISMIIAMQNFIPDRRATATCIIVIVAMNMKLLWL